MLWWGHHNGDNEGYHAAIVYPHGYLCQDGRGGKVGMYNRELNDKVMATQYANNKRVRKLELPICGERTEFWEKVYKDIVWQSKWDVVLDMLLAFHEFCIENDMVNLDVGPGQHGFFKPMKGESHGRDTISEN